MDEYTRLRQTLLAYDTALIYLKIGVSEKKYQSILQDSCAFSTEIKPAETQSEDVLTRNSTVSDPGKPVEIITEKKTIVVNTIPSSSYLQKKVDREFHPRQDGFSRITNTPVSRIRSAPEEIHSRHRNFERQEYGQRGLNSASSPRYEEPLVGDRKRKFEEAEPEDGEEVDIQPQRLSRCVSAPFSGTKSSEMVPNSTPVRSVSDRRYDTFSQQDNRFRQMNATDRRRDDAWSQGRNGNSEWSSYRRDYANDRYYR